MILLEISPLLIKAPLTLARWVTQCLSEVLLFLLVKQTFVTIKDKINLSIAEHGLDMHNPFSAIYMPDSDIRKQASIPVEKIR